MSRRVNVHTYGECYVVRVRPWNARRWRGSFSMQAKPLEALQRLMEFDHRWILTVRRCADDPWGPTLHEEEIARRSEISAAIQSVELLLKSHRLPAPSESP